MVYGDLSEMPIRMAYVCVRVCLGGEGGGGASGALAYPTNNARMAVLAHSLN